MANTGDIPNNITLGASQTVRRNAGDTGFEAFTPSGGAHTILSTTHTDTLVDSVVRGDLIVGNLTPKWARLALGGSAKSFVTRDASDVVWSTGLLDVATGKTLSVNNSVTLSGTDGKSLTLTGSLTVPVDGTAALGAGTLTVSTINDVTGAAHTHAITSSSNPGIAASLLATDASGELTLSAAPNLAGGSDVVLNYSNGGIYSYSILKWLATGTARVITLPDLSGTVALGAGTLTVSSANSVTVASHTHAVTTSSNPGAAAAILATDASGNLTLAGVLTVTNAAPSLVLTDTTASAKSLTIAVDANAANFRESAGAAGSLLVLDLANNRVGIGVAPTVGSLHIQAANNAQGFYVKGGATAGQSYGFLVDAGTNTVDSAFHVRDVTGGTEFMLVRGDGRVGIGTVTPGARLDVNDTTDSTTTTTGAIITAGGVGISKALTVGTGFGCNSKTPQTAFASGGAAPAGGTGATAGAYDTAAHRDALITLVNNIRTALVNNGIMS